MTVATILFSLSACGKSSENEDPYNELSKNELIALARGYEASISALNTELTEKTTLLQGIQS